jgi:hypothetical protein
MLDKGDMERVENASAYSVPETVGFYVWSIANQDAWLRTLVDFGIVGLDEGERVAPNFAEMGQGRDMPRPYLVRSSPIQGGSGGEI